MHIMHVMAVRGLAAVEMVVVGMEAAGRAVEATVVKERAAAGMEEGEIALLLQALLIF